MTIEASTIIYVHGVQDGLHISIRAHGDNWYPDAKLETIIPLTMAEDLRDELDVEIRKAKRR